MMSPESATLGVACTLMPTVRNVYDDNGFTFAPPPAMGENVVVKIRLIGADLQRQRRALGAPKGRLASNLLLLSVSRKSTTAEGTPR